ncbi:MAG TPA: hypothetical protein PK167_03455 [Prolixibacteraceae bacterium]|nr:hypothetical protein [Prolixibacteraceae bacterium]
MILQAVISTVKKVIDAYPIIGDIEAVTPFAAIDVKQKPFFTKNGICGYSNTAEIIIVHQGLSVVMQKSEEVKTVVAAMAGTIDQTEIENVRFIEEEQSFDEKSQCYINLIQYQINSKNQ